MGSSSAPRLHGIVWLLIAGRDGSLLITVDGPSGFPPTALRCSFQRPRFVDAVRLFIARWISRPWTAATKRRALARGNSEVERASERFAPGDSEFAARVPRAAAQQNHAPGRGRHAAHGLRRRGTSNRPRIAPQHYRFTDSRGAVPRSDRVSESVRAACRRRRDCRACISERSNAAWRVASVDPRSFLEA